MGFEMVDFKKDVIDACQRVPVVIDFWAEWCGPCRVLGPVIEKLAGEARGKWTLVKINTDKNPQIAAQFGIQGIPAVKMVYQGQLIGEFTGALPEVKIREWLKKHLPATEPEPEEVLNLDALYESGDRRTLKSVLEMQTKADPENKEMRARLAMALLPARMEEAEKWMAGLSESKFEIEREAVQLLKEMVLVEKTGLPQASNKTVPGFFKNGVSALLKEDWEPALDAFIQVMMRDRTYLDDAARKACVAIFAMLGEKHPVTKAWRRRFSMALY